MVGRHTDPRPLAMGAPNGHESTGRDQRSAPWLGLVWRLRVQGYAPHMPDRDERAEDDSSESQEADGSSYRLTDDPGSAAADGSSYRDDDAEDSESADGSSYRVRDDPGSATADGSNYRDR